jgi:hypothetical protein
MKILLAVGVIAAFGTVALWCLAEDAIAEYEKDDMR